MKNLLSNALQAGLAAAGALLQTLGAQVPQGPAQKPKAREEGQKQMKQLGNITKIDGGKIEPVDCITFGSPCQDMSIAGQRAGLAGERSVLFFEAVRIIKEMRETTHGRYPTFAVWENVPGSFSSHKGEDFRAVLESLARVSDPAAYVSGPPKGKWRTSGAIVGDGWSLAFRVHDAQFWGVPQRRRRIALVVDFGGNRAPEILFDPQSLPGDSEEGEGAWEGAAARTEGGAGIPGGALPGDDSGTGRGLEAVHSGVTAYALSPLVMATGQAGAEIEKDLSPTLNCDHEQPVVLPFDTTQITSKENGSHPMYGSPCHPLAAQAHPPCISVVFDPNSVAHTLKGKSNLDFREDSDTLIYTGRFVRRLIPLEGERLQGYPDGWTDIGPWTDSKGKWHRESSDSARYTALGNSIALPFWLWLTKRMAVHLPAGATLGSLFDGIGGFPLCWETVHGKGTARWASEIEEFPMAVTRKRFGEGKEETYEQNQN